ncbi:Putative 2-aminoethylphosphonate import ATP-binding protein PhnT [Corynebacterium ciconiae DSM 44920]|uniref:ATP-binding cassette domain-containing protein n=1 Tax=Corynebacterium ciconiae TaxID=227319 RepID=UPI0003826FCB|nr:ATP-binding cassette domain-containing protein [Corynebacterium ciconiae]WKD60969.1 Putative 2-aminoethylphosphonate import ATP-binding protein PhnT [Corynebacterium ciconiae DSM 44920]
MPAELTSARSRQTIPVIVAAWCGLCVIIAPVLALLWRVPWQRVPEILSEPPTRELISVTVTSAVWATVIATVLGLAVALWLHTLRAGRSFTRLLVLLPLALPPVVGGMALTSLLGVYGISAPVLDTLGLRFAFAFPGVVASHVFVALPFVVITIEQALAQLSPRVQSSARSVGMSTGAITRHILIPTVAPALASGAGLACARSLGEFGTTLTFAGSYPGITRTLPIGIYLEREIDPERALVLAAVLMLLAIAVLGAALGGAWLWLRPRFTGAAHTATLQPINTSALAALTAPIAPAETLTFGPAAQRRSFPAARTTALVGENGAGKTTVARLIVGELTGTEITLGETVLDPGVDRSQPRLWRSARLAARHRTAPVPIHARGIVLLTQDSALPPRMRVHRAVSVVCGSANTASELLAAAGLSDLADLPIGSLSGGQQAQVALLRGLAARPHTLIVDEPMAALDAASASRWRAVLKACSHHRTVILISHNVVDIATLAHYAAVLEAGDITAFGPVEQMMQQPPTAFMAYLAGLNRLHATVVSSSSELITVSCSGQGIEATYAPDASTAPHTAPLEPASDVAVLFSPTAVSIATTAAPSGTSARNCLNGAVVALEHSGDQVSVHVQLAESTQRLRAAVTARSVAELGLAIGTEVSCSFKALATTVHPMDPTEHGRSFDHG